jgi:hypothetical protein
VPAFDGKKHYIETREPTGTLMELDNVAVQDATYVSANGQSLYLLKSCP